MGNKRRESSTSGSSVQRIQLPKDALSRIDLGHSFAEYDQILQRPGVFVTTPQMQLAAKPGGGCFFVGRRGTGKTATTLFLESRAGLTIQLHPQVFEFQTVQLDVASHRDTRQRPFRGLLYAFQRAILDEVVSEWMKRKLIKPSVLPTALTRERNYIDDYDFDTRFLAFVTEFQEARSNDKEWLRLTKRASVELPDAFNEVAGSNGALVASLLFDRIDEGWDGSDQAVLLLMALMHACVELSPKCSAVLPKIFLRENIFERVREIDNEFARLETFVVSMDWTQEQLLELIERRLNLPFNTKLPLRGPTWDYFFENAQGSSSRQLVFDYCQDRPRDVLTYCKFAIESAQGRKHEHVTIEDLQSARKRFSDSRLKDLGDEYAENYPQIQLVLSRFFGTGTRFTVSGIEAFVKKLLVDDEIKQHCARWLFHYTTTDRFIHLFYNIGFFGISDEGTPASYRSLGAKSSTPPSITGTTLIEIHPSYQHALSLRDVVLGELDESKPLQQSGVLVDLPDAISLADYEEKLRSLLEDLKTLPRGDESAAQFEEIVGEVIRLCFFRALGNVQPKSRDVGGKVIRDWIASNRASGGFWEMVRQRYGATQVIWECKNYDALAADDFHQLLYYSTTEIGSFTVCVYRGEAKQSYYEHIKRVSHQKDGNAMILLITERDLQTFLRQAAAGKAKEDHIQGIYDRIVRAIS